MVSILLRTRLKCLRRIDKVKCAQCGLLVFVTSMPTAEHCGIKYQYHPQSDFAECSLSLKQLKTDWYIWGWRRYPQGAPWPERPSLRLIPGGKNA